MNTDGPFLPRTFGSVSPRRRREVVSTVERPKVRPIPEENRHSGLKRLKSRSWSSIRRWEKENELLFAMIEDEAEWLAGLFPEEIIAPEFFFFALEDGVLLCKLANLIQEFVVKYGKERKIEVVESNIKYHPRNKTRGQLGQFRARENVTEFLLWCRRLSVPEVILFESNDVVQTEDLREGAREVVICLMEVARRAAKYGVPPPRLIVLENEIEQEERQDECSSPSSVDSGVETENDINRQNRNSVKIEIIIKRPESEQNDVNSKLDSNDEKNSESQINPETKENKEKENSQEKKDSDIDQTDNVTKPQSALDEKVLNLIKEYSAGKITRLKEGKYIILGRVMFVRMLNEHVLVRIGGGWDGLEHYLMTHVNRGSQTPHPSFIQNSDSRSNTPTNLASTKHSSRNQSRADLAASNPSLAESNKGEFRSFTPPLLPNFIARGRESPVRKTSRVKDTDEADIAKAIRRIETTVSENIHKKTSSTSSLIDITPSVENCKKCSDNRKLLPGNMESSETSNFTHTNTDANVIKHGLNSEIPADFERLGQANFENEGDVMSRADTEGIHPVVKSDDNNNKDDISIDSNIRLVNGDLNTELNAGDPKADELEHEATKKAEIEVVVTKQANEAGKASGSVKDKKTATSSKTKKGAVTADKKGPKPTSTSKTATKATAVDKTTTDTTKKANPAKTAAAKSGKAAVAAKDSTTKGPAAKTSSTKPNATKAAPAKTAATKSSGASSTTKTTTTKPAPKPTATATAKPSAAKAPSAKTTASKPAAKTAKGVDSKVKQGADSTDGAAISKSTNVTSVKTTTVTTKTSKAESASKKPAGKNDVSKPKATAATKLPETTATKPTKAPSAAAKSTATNPAPAKTKTADASAKKATTDTKKPATASAKPSSAPAKAAKKPAESSKPTSAPAKSNSTSAAPKTGTATAKSSTTATKTTTTTKAATTKTTAAASKAAAPKSAPPKSAASKPAPQKAVPPKSAPAAVKAAKPATKSASTTTTKSTSVKPADKKAADKKPTSPSKSKAEPKKAAASSTKVSSASTDKVAKAKKPADTKAAKAGKSPTKDSKKAPKDDTKTKKTESKTEKVEVLDVKTETVAVTENLTVEAVVSSATELNEPVSLEDSSKAVLIDPGTVETRVKDEVPEGGEIAADVRNEVVDNELPVTKNEIANIESCAVERDVEGTDELVAQRTEAEGNIDDLTDISKTDDPAINDNAAIKDGAGINDDVTALGSDVQLRSDHGFEAGEAEEVVASPTRNVRGETFDLEPNEDIQGDKYEEETPKVEERFAEQAESPEQFTEEQSYQMEDDEARDSESAKFDESKLISLEEITVKCEDGDAREGAVAPTPPETPVPDSVTPESQAKDSNVDLQLEDEEEFHAREFNPGDTPAVTPMLDSTVMKVPEEAALEGFEVERPEVEDDAERRGDHRQEEHGQEAGSEVAVSEELATEYTKEELDTEQGEDLKQGEHGIQAEIELVDSEEQKIVSTMENFTSQEKEVSEKEERPRVEDVSHDYEFQNENEIATEEQTYRVDEISHEDERPIDDALTQPDRAEEISFEEESVHKDAFVQDVDSDLQEDTLKDESAKEINEDTLKAVDHLATDEDSHELIATTVTETFKKPENSDMKDFEKSMAEDSHDVIEDKSSHTRADVEADEGGISSESSPSAAYDTDHQPAIFSQEVEIHELAGSMDENTEDFDGRNRDDFIQDEQSNEILVPMATVEEVSPSEERPEEHDSPVKSSHMFKEDQAAFDQDDYRAASPVADECDENTEEDFAYGIGHRGTEELMQRGYIEDDLIEDNEARQQYRNEEEAASQSQERNKAEDQSARHFGDYEREDERDIAQTDVLVNKENVDEQQDVYNAGQGIETNATAAPDEDNFNAIPAQQNNVPESITQHDERTDSISVQQDDLFDEITVQRENIVESQPEATSVQQDDLFDEITVQRENIVESQPEATSVQQDDLFDEITVQRENIVESQPEAASVQQDDLFDEITVQRENIVESQPEETSVQQDELFDEITVQHENIAQSQPDNLFDTYDEKENEQTAESDFVHDSVNSASVVNPEPYEGQNEMMHPELGLEEQDHDDGNNVRADADFHAQGSTTQSDDAERLSTKYDIEKPEELELESQFAVSQHADDAYTPVSDLPEGLTSPFAQISFDQYPEGKEGTNNYEDIEVEAGADEDAEFDSDVMERAKESLRVAKSLDDSYEDEQKQTDTQQANIEELDAQDARETPVVVPQVISSPCISSESEDSDSDEEKDQLEVIAARESTVEAVADSAEGHEKETAKDVALEDLNPFHDNENNSADMKQHSEEHISYQQNSNIASFEQPDQTENEPESCITKEQSEFSTKSFEEDPNPFENEATPPSELQQSFPDQETCHEPSDLYHIKGDFDGGKETFQHHVQHDTYAVQDPEVNPFHEEHAQQDSPLNDTATTSQEQDLKIDSPNREQVQTESSIHDRSNVEQLDDAISDSLQRENLEQDSLKFDHSNRTDEDLEQSSHTESYDQGNRHEAFQQSTNSDEMDHDPDSSSKGKGLMSESHYSDEDAQPESVSDAEAGLVQESSGEQATDGSDFVLVDSPIKHADPNSNLVDPSSNLVDPEEVSLGFKQGMVASTESGSDDSPFHHIELKTDEIPMEERDDAFGIDSNNADSLEDYNAMPNDTLYDASVTSDVCHAADNGVKLTNESQDYGSTSDQLQCDDDRGAKIQSENHDTNFESQNNEDCKTTFESRNHETNIETGNYDFESEYTESERHTISSTFQGDSINTEETYTIHTTYSAQYEENRIEGASHFAKDFNPNASAAYVNSIPINSNTMATFDHHGGGENFSGPQYVYDGSDDDDETY